VQIFLASKLSYGFKFLHELILDFDNYLDLAEDQLHEFKEEIRIRRKRSIVSWINFGFGGSENTTVKITSCSLYPSLTFNVSTFEEFQARFVEFFCPNVDFLLNFYSTSFTQCCLQTCLAETTCTLGDPAALEICGLDITCLFSSPSISITGIEAITQCPAYATSNQNAIMFLNNKYCIATTTTAPPTTTLSIIQVIQQAAPAAVATVVGVGGVGLLIQPPPPPPVTPQGIPPGNPLPGTPGGGAPPVATTPEAATALGLAPPGTVPVALFPPYATPRTLPAITVIFAENPAITVAAARRSDLSKKVSHYAGKNSINTYKLVIFAIFFCFGRI
jgi:hypothetical protein